MECSFAGMVLGVKAKAILDYPGIVSKSRCGITWYGNGYGVGINTRGKYIPLVSCSSFHPGRNMIKPG